MKILIVKLSSLGDVVHAMPAVQDIRHALPEAQIDWVVERAFAPLVRRCEGVNRVIECEFRSWRKSFYSFATRRAWHDFKESLQAETYDAVIDLQGLSKSALISWLARLTPQGQRYGLAGATTGSSFEAPARWVADVSFALGPHVHAVARSRQLCARAFGYALQTEDNYGLRAAPQPEVPLAGSAAEHGRPPRVAFVHATSRTDKQWPLAHWQALGRSLNAQGYDVVLPHGNAAEQEAAEQIAQALEQAEIWPRLALDELTDALAGCAGVIGVDSGLSHIAVALDLPHVQLYNVDTSWRTGPQPSPRQCSVFALPTPSLEAVAQAWRAVSQAGKRA
jgi:heptosyltransferase-1